MRDNRSLLVLCRFGGKHGWGHVTRCSALCDWGRTLGWKTELATSSDPIELASETQAAFDVVSRYPTMDLESILANRDNIDCVLIDEMYWDDSFYSQARDLVGRVNGARLVAIDDMNKRSLGSAHLVLNTEFGLRSADYDASATLLGERYALIRRGFSRPRTVAWPGELNCIRVLVMIGGTDPLAVAESVLSCLLEREEPIVPVVVSGDGVREKSIMEQLNRFPHFEYRQRLPSQELAGWVAACDFGIIGCGTSVFEFAAMDTPFAGVVVADNQLRTATQLKERGLPVVSAIDGGDIRIGLHRVVDALAQSSRDGLPSKLATVDLRGCERVLEAIDRL